MNKQSHLNIFSAALSLTLTMPLVAQAARAEGPSRAPGGMFNEDKQQFTGADVRFTQ